MQPVLAYKYTRAVTTVDFIAVHVKDCSQLSFLVSEFNESLPLPPQLSHLKRVKSTVVKEKKQFCILLVPPEQLPPKITLFTCVKHFLPSLPIETMRALGDVILVKVPDCIPLTSMRFAEAKNIWPTVFSHNRRVEMQLSGKPFSDTRLQEMGSYMRTALQLANEGRMLGAVPIASVVVDPSKNKILASHYHSPRNSLDHSVMRCIREVAGLQVDTQVATGVKRKLDDVEMQDLSNSSEYYLCTGLELYTTQEPCVMCSMALVHARISMVIYGMSNAEMGGLGSVYKIHCQEGLNHHFDVFKGFLEQDCIQLWHH